MSAAVRGLGGGQAQTGECAAGSASSAGAAGSGWVGIGVRQDAFGLQELVLQVGRPSQAGAGPGSGQGPAVRARTHHRARENAPRLPHRGQVLCIPHSAARCCSTSPQPQCCCAPCDAFAPPLPPAEDSVCLSQSMNCWQREASICCARLTTWLVWACVLQI